MMTDNLKSVQFKCPSSHVNNVHNKHEIDEVNVYKIFFSRYRSNNKKWRIFVYKKYKPTLNELHMQQQPRMERATA